MVQKQNKYLYLHVIQGNYVGYGWEDLSAYGQDEYKEARSDLKAYRENERGIPHRLIRRREINPKYRG
ncbi:MAG: hypothetical protein EOM59_16055 [Clostridia bacterium]|nr:hypothetical protein [Clostridia bacterium]